jgi:hypothetical protein
MPPPPLKPQLRCRRRKPPAPPPATGGCAGVRRPASAAPTAGPPSPPLTQPAAAPAATACSPTTASRPGSSQRLWRCSGRGASDRGRIVTELWDFIGMSLHSLPTPHPRTQALARIRISGSLGSRKLCSLEQPWIFCVCTLD